MTDTETELLESMIDACSQISGKCLNEDELLCSQGDSEARTEAMQGVEEGATKAVETNQETDNPVCDKEGGPLMLQPKPNAKLQENPCKRRRKPGKRERARLRKQRDSKTDLTTSSTASIEPKRQRFDLAEMEKSLPASTAKASTPKTAEQKAESTIVDEANAKRVKERNKRTIEQCDDPKPGTSKSSEGNGVRKELTGKGKTRPQSTNNTNPPKRKRYSEVVGKNFWRVLIAEGDELTEAQQEQIIKTLNSAIKACVVSKKRAVQIEGIDKSQGKLIIKCANESSCQWIESETPNFDFKWGKVVCKALDDLPRLVKCVSWIPFQDVTRDEVLSLVQGQNPSINTEKWRIWSLIPEDKGQILTLGVDEDSITALGKINNRPYLLHRRVHFRIAKETQTSGGKGRADAAKEQPNG